MTKTVYLVAFTFLWLNSLCSQSFSFQSAADLPAARSATGHAANGLNVYIANGLGPNTQFGGEVFSYEVSTNTWDTLTLSTIPKRFGSAAIIATNLYLFNGQLANGLANDQLEVIDLGSGDISLAATNPNPVRAAGVAMLDDKIYSFGGRVNQLEWSNQMSVYDPDFDSWTSLTPMPAALETKGAIVNGKIYVVGGFNGGVSDQIYVYDIDDNSWITSFTMPVGISANAVTTDGSILYILGDFSELSFFATYDPSNNEFTLYDDTNLVAGRHRAAAVIDNRLFTFGGNVASDISTAIPNVQFAGVLTSKREIAATLPVGLFPNPAVDIIQWQEAFEEVSVLDQNGRLLMELLNGQQQLEVGGFPTGTYYLKARKNGQLFLEKWIKH